MLCVQMKSPFSWNPILNSIHSTSPILPCLSIPFHSNRVQPVILELGLLLLLCMLLQGTNSMHPWDYSPWLSTAIHQQLHFDFPAEPAHILFTDLWFIWDSLPPDKSISLILHIPVQSSQPCLVLPGDHHRSRITFESNSTAD